MFGGSKRYRAGLVAGAVALVAVVFATVAYAVDPPPRTASYVVTGPASVTVKQGQSTTFILRMTGTGTLPCDVDYGAWAAVDSTFEARKSFSGTGFIAQSVFPLSISSLRRSLAACATRVGSVPRFRSISRRRSLPRAMRRRHVYAEARSDS
jgi:hypothetical protein